MRGERRLRQRGDSGGASEAHLRRDCCSGCEASCYSSARSSIPPGSTPATAPPPRPRLRCHRRPRFANRHIRRIQMEAAPKKSNPAARLTEDLLVKIFRRLPVRSVCRFKCVSRSWYKLLSHPDHGVPQTLAGFFHTSWNGERFPRSAYHFTNVHGKGVPLIYPSFSFLPVPRENVVLIDSCNGLLLCRCYERGPGHDGAAPFHYMVCNPAMKKWLMLPDSCRGARGAGKSRTAHLGFDPTVSSHFHVIEYVLDQDEYIIGVEIYSSKTAAWSLKESKWADEVMLDNTKKSVFLNGFMYMLAFSGEIIIVDMEGKTWRKILVPGDGKDGPIHQTQGRLLYFDVDDYACKLSVWILEDYGKDEWTIKYKISTLGLFGGKRLQYVIDYEVIAVHPECNLVFFVYGWDNTLMAYEMDRKEVRVIRNLGHDSHRPFLPYVPFFSDSLAEEH